MPRSKTSHTKGATLRSTGFLEPYSFYSKLFDAGERTIKRWASVGREKGDLPPFDKPELMKSWWSKHMTQRVPPKILDLAKGRIDGDEEVADTELFSQPVVPEKPAEPFVIPDDLDVGLEASVLRLRRAEAVANLKYINALEKNENEGEIEMLQRRWERVSNQLRQQEKLLRELEGKYGQLYGEAEIRKALEPLHMVIATGIKNLERKLRPQLRLIDDDHEKDALWDRAISGLFRRFGDSQFSNSLEELAVGE